MKRNGKYILEHLVDQYENSVLSKQGTIKNVQKRFIFSVKNMPDYYKMESYNYRMELLNELQMYANKAWITIAMEEEDEIHSVTLHHEHIDEIYLFLKRTSKRENEEALCSLLWQYKGKGIDIVLDDLFHRIEHFEPYASLLYMEEAKNRLLLDALCAVLTLQKEMAERVFSTYYLHDSKAFASIQAKIVKLLRLYFDANEESDEEVLASYGIIKNPGYVYFKGNISFRIGNTTIHLQDFQNEFSLSSAMIEHIQFLKIEAKQVVTIENLTSYYMADDRDTVFVYLGGYHNHIRRNFLMKLYAFLHEAQYYHFGDIDAGGFYILEHLKNKTGIPFQPLYMDMHTLKRYESKALPLTQHDIQRLHKVKDIPIYQEVISYMLERKIKLEQENVSFVAIK